MNNSWMLFLGSFNSDKRSPFSMPVHLLGDTLRYKAATHQFTPPGNEENRYSTHTLISMVIGYAIVLYLHSFLILSLIRGNSSFDIIMQTSAGEGTLHIACPNFTELTPHKSARCPGKEVTQRAGRGNTKDLSSRYLAKLRQGLKHDKAFKEKYQDW
jgi:hypothetical protein